MRISLQTLWCVALTFTLAGCGSKPATETATSEPAPAAEPAPATTPATSAFGGVGKEVAERAAERLPNTISAAAAKDFLQAHSDALVLDVRDPNEWNDDVGHIDGSLLIPLGELAQRGGEIRAYVSKPVIVVCRVGQRSDVAASALRKAGFQNVANLEGGLEAWRRAGY